MSKENPFITKSARNIFIFASGSIFAIATLGKIISKPSGCFSEVNWKNTSKGRPIAVCKDHNGIFMAQGPDTEIRLLPTQMKTINDFWGERDNIIKWSTHDRESATYYYYNIKTGEIKEVGPFYIPSKY